MNETYMRDITLDGYNLEGSVLSSMTGINNERALRLKAGVVQVTGDSMHRLRLVPDVSN